MRGQRAKLTTEQDEASQDAATEVVDVSEHQPRRIPSKKWRELIKKVWEADPMLCPKCSREMRVVALSDAQEVIERILRHLGLWEKGVLVRSGTDPPPEPILEPFFEDPFPDYDTEPVMAYEHV
jgi:hypothetical protein